MKYRQWVVDVIPCKRPHAERLKTSGQCSVASGQQNLYAPKLL